MSEPQPQMSPEPRLCQADTGIQRKGCRAFANLGEFQVSREAIHRRGSPGQGKRGRGGGPAGWGAVYTFSFCLVVFFKGNPKGTDESVCCSPCFSSSSFFKVECRMGEAEKSWKRAGVILP